MIQSPIFNKMCDRNETLVSNLYCQNQKPGMKKFILMIVGSLFLLSCDNKQTSTETTMESKDVGDSVVTTETTTTTSTYIPSEGDVSYRNGKVVVWKNNAWVETSGDVVMNDGVVIKANGEVTKDGKQMRLEEGESVNTSGKFFNKTGEALEDAWDATKKGVRKAGEAIEKAGKKLGEEIKDSTR
jgi:hypothetical protein